MRARRQRSAVEFVFEFVHKPQREEPRQHGGADERKRLEEPDPAHRDRRGEEPRHRQTKRDAAAYLHEEAVDGAADRDEERVVNHAVHREGVASHRDAQRAHRRVRHVGLGAEETDRGPRPQREQEAERERDAAADYERGANSFLYSYEAAPPVVEGDEGDERVADAHQGAEGYILDAQRNHPARYRDVAVGLGEHAVDRAHAERDASGRERDGQADGGDGAPYREHLAARRGEQRNLYRAVAAHLSYKVDRARRASDEGSRGGSSHAPAEDEDEERVEHEVQAVRDEEETQRRHRVALAAEDGVHDVGEGYDHRHRRYPHVVEPRLAQRLGVRRAEHAEEGVRRPGE